MNGSKGDNNCQNLCCTSGIKSVYLGIIVFILGLMLANQASTPQILMIIGSITTMLGLISMFSQKK